MKPTSEGSHARVDHRQGLGAGPRRPQSSVLSNAAGEWRQRPPGRKISKVATSARSSVTKCRRDDAHLITDEYKGYLGMSKVLPHSVIRHSRWYVDGEIHTNTIEGFLGALETWDVRASFTASAEDICNATWMSFVTATTCAVPVRTTHSHSPSTTDLGASNEHSEGNTHRRTSHWFSHHRMRCA